MIKRLFNKLCKRSFDYEKQIEEESYKYLFKKISDRYTFSSAELEYIIESIIDNKTNAFKKITNEYQINETCIEICEEVYNLLTNDCNLNYFNAGIYTKENITLLLNEDIIASKSFKNPIDAICLSKRKVCLKQA